MRRTLLIQQKLKNNDSDEIRKEMRGLGVIAVQELQAKKVD